jgi:thymidylate synthase ThyX
VEYDVMHIFAMRTDKAAHWEIRGVMCALLDELRGGSLAPLFLDFEPVIKGTERWYVKVRREN